MIMETVLIIIYICLYRFTIMCDLMFLLRDTNRLISVETNWKPFVSQIVVYIVCFKCLLWLTYLFDATIL